MQTQLTVGSRWLCGDRIVEIDGPLSLYQVQVRDAGTGNLLPVAIGTLKPIPTSRRDAEPSVVPQAEWDRARAIAKALAPYVADHLPRQVADELAEQFDVCLRQIRRWLARYRQNQQTTALVPRSGGRPRGLRLLDPQVEQLIQHVISKHYARREAASQSEVCERIRLMCQRLQRSPPARKTIVSRIRAEDSFHLALKRQGSKAARQQFEPRPGKLTAERALRLIQIDHTRADINLVADDDPTRVIGRPWLTLAIDVATRAVAGYYLSMETPSAISVAMCVAHMMLPKAENDIESGLWPMYGTPEAILVDNGKDLRSLAFQRGCEQHGIDLKWRPVAEPHYGAHIERLMGTFMRRVHTLPGTTFSNVKQRGDYPSESKACLTLADFRAWVIEQICRGYHVRHHRGLGMPPLVAWERSFQDENGHCVLPAAPMERSTLRRDFYPFVHRRLQRTGVQFAQSRYWNPALAPLIHPNRVVKVHYHPDNPACVWVRADDDILIEATVVAGVALGEGKRATLDGSEQARLDAIKLLGYDRSDAVRTEAERGKRQHGRSQATSSAAKQKRQRRVTASGSTTTRPQVPLSRASVRAEVLDS
ncbi:Mu transposase C-terminal domain-containing protein [Dyella lutea]|uniref:DDE-type integrase/transposase/recombinase n=1 Tax=Dyella lutea TaxID=2950441 RepID=A0ABT1FCQ6_9GAMM|nr:Mu transposase C-terminal domain-containing protein [Dyella lutea]MCP1375162.1 DDE-type integrase/transposase/recombinase [Dyella lutea]